VAYVGFGTVPLYRDRPKLIAALVEALLGHGFTAVVTTPDAALGSQLAALDPGRVHVAEWVSLPSLIERCDLVVCHGGAGTVLGSLAAGVPLVLVPQGAPSQLRMSRACAERGVGIALDPGRLVRAELDRALGEFIANDGFKAAAAEVAVEIADMPSCDKAARSLQAITYAASGSQA
jgi:UDP:flavonoid glycosyltransferase YjiC (YdhE family)